MSKNQSIDGLQRRTSSSTARRIETKKTKQPTKKKPVVKKSATVKKTNQTKNLSLKTKTEKPADNSAIADFLASVQDVDPTDLVEVSPEEKGRGWFKKKKPKTKKHHRLRWIFLVILIFLAIAGYILYAKFNGIYSQVNGGNILSALISPDVPLKKDENGRTNILVFGTEGYDMNNPNYDGGYLTDSMMVLSFDQENGDTKAISMPRDLKAQKTCTGTGKFNEIFWCQYSKVGKNTDRETIEKYETAGAQDLENAFEQVLGVDVQYYVHLNWQALIQVVDAIGGIDVVFTYGDQSWDGNEVTIKTTDKRGLADGNGRKMFYKYPNGQVIHLTGEWALAVARTRNSHGGYGAAGGNFSREYFQQRIIEAVVKKARSINLTADWGAAMKILSAVGDNVRTDFKDNEMKTLLKVANNVEISTLESISLVSPTDGTKPLMTTGMINGISYVLPTAGVGKYDAIHKYVAKKLSNSYEAEQAAIVVLNGTSAYGIASNEKTLLEEKNFTVKSTANAPADLSGFDGVKIFSKTENMPKTQKALKERYGVEPSRDLPKSIESYECDFIVIIGNGYSTKTEKE